MHKERTGNGKYNSLSIRRSRLELSARRDDPRLITRRPRRERGVDQETNMVAYLFLRRSRRPVGV